MAMVQAGEWILADEPVAINEGRRTVRLKVRNTGDRPIQIGSHFHFFEVNRALDFARVQAMGMHLNVPAGTGVRFEPGDEKEVELVEFGGMKRVIGFNGLVNGSVQAKWTLKEALERARDLEFAGMDDNLEQETAAVTSRLAKEDQGKKVVQRQGKEQHQGQGKEQQS
jgi:urease subunit beta/urease subunit gamma/beta